MAVTVLLSSQESKFVSRKSIERLCGVLCLALAMVLGNAAYPNLLHADPYARPDSFFEKDYLNKDREISSEESKGNEPRDSGRSSEDSFENNPDSWEAPRRNMPEQSVAGSDRVREYRDGTGRFASSSSSSAPYAIPGSNAKAIPLPGVGVLVLPGATE
jgi:hypothetical protein